MSDTTYRRLVLKLSGEILAGDNGFGIDPSKANRLAQEIKTIHDMGITIGLVIELVIYLEVFKLLLMVFNV